MIIIMNQIKTHLIAAGESIAYTLVRFPVKHHLTPISIIISSPTHPKKKLADATSRNSHLLPADILHRVLMVKASDCLTLATTTSQQNLQDGIKQWQYVVWPN